MTDPDPGAAPCPLRQQTDTFNKTITLPRFSNRGSFLSGIFTDFYLSGSSN